VAGGSSMGRTVALTGLRIGGARIGAVRRGLMGWTGVPKAGEDEGIRFLGTADGFSGRLEVDIFVIQAAPSRRYTLIVVAGVN
jgi:hypothetical protein